MVIERRIALIERDGEALRVEHLDLMPSLPTRFDKTAGRIALRRTGKYS
jgi:hypothetical protein